METGFLPFYQKDSKVLILGSFPSVKSREVNFYYGNARNRFWSILEKSKNTAKLTTRNEKKEFLLKHNIALWDIVYKCEIKGSADSSIKIIEVADIDKLLSLTQINKILCNGKTAYNIFMCYYEKYRDITISLPSTSPANFKFDENAWLNALSFVK